MKWYFIHQYSFTGELTKLLMIDDPTLKLNVFTHLVWFLNLFIYFFFLTFPYLSYSTLWLFSSYLSYSTLGFFFSIFTFSMSVGRKNVYYWPCFPHFIIYLPGPIFISSSLTSPHPPLPLKSDVSALTQPCAFDHKFKGILCWMPTTAWHLIQKQIFYAYPSSLLPPDRKLFAKMLILFVISDCTFFPVSLDLATFCKTNHTQSASFSLNKQQRNRHAKNKYDRSYQCKHKSVLWTCKKTGKIKRL